MTDKEKLKKINELTSFLMITSNESRTKSILEVIMALCLSNKKQIEGRKEPINEVLKNVGFPMNLFSEE